MCHCSSHKCMCHCRKHCYFFTTVGNIIGIESLFGQHMEVCQYKDIWLFSAIREYCRKSFISYHCEEDLEICTIIQVTSAWANSGNIVCYSPCRGILDVWPMSRQSMNMQNKDCVIYCREDLGICVVVAITYYYTITGIFVISCHHWDFLEYVPI